VNQCPGTDRTPDETGYATVARFPSTGSNPQRDSNRCAEWDFRRFRWLSWPRCRTSPTGALQEGAVGGLVGSACPATASTATGG
jgi:hypothetical protein